ncbi:MAG: alpha/beta hydrolase [Pseudonocardia sp.]|nr:alpha/beta hydrolase [Pseudonocardia sp.]
MSGRYLAPTARALAADRRVVAPDLPGSGHTPRAARPLTIAELADLLAELVAASAGPAVVVANSFGCQLAVELALRHPAAVRRLVLTGPVLAPPVRGLPEVARRFVAAMRHEPWSYLGVVVLDNLRGWTRKGRVLRVYPIEEELTVPALVVRGEQDRLVPEPFARRLADLVPDGRHVEVATPHALTYHGPRTLAHLVRR